MRTRVVPMQNLTRLHKSLEIELQESLYCVVNSSAFIGGQDVKKFENSFAEFIGSKHCIGVANGTDALELIFEGLGIGAGHSVLVPTMTFAATAEAVVRVGATPVFTDVGVNDLLINVETAEYALTQARAAGYVVKALVAVHLYGKPCDMPALMNFCDKNDLLLVEDAAQAHGATHLDPLSGQYRSVGSWGVASAFSFYPGKNLGAWGDAGAITTNSTDLADRCRLLANHGRKDKYDHLIVGRNSRLDAIQAAILNVKLKYLSQWNGNRTELALRYTKHLSKHSQLEALSSPQTDHLTHVYHQYVVRMQSPQVRDRAIIHFREKGIEVGVHYPSTLPSMNAFKNYPAYLTQSDSAQHHCDALLSLPMDPLHSLDDIDYVCSVMAEFLTQ